MLLDARLRASDCPDLWVCSPRGPRLSWSDCCAHMSGQMATTTFASWNQTREWIRRFKAFRRVRLRTDLLWIATG
jgi:hypothetical protein